MNTPVIRWTTELNRHFTKEVQIANKKNGYITSHKKCKSKQHWNSILLQSEWQLQANKQQMLVGGRGRGTFRQDWWE
jgi:hypothetical protein